MHQQFIGGIKNGELFYYNIWRLSKFMEIDLRGGRAMFCRHLFTSTVKMLLYRVYLN